MFADVRIRFERSKNSVWKKFRPHILGASGGRVGPGMAKTRIAAVALALILGWSLQGTAQTVQYVTITAYNTNSGGSMQTSLPLQTNQLVSCAASQGVYSMTGNFANGVSFTLVSNGPFTGLTNITVTQNPGTFPAPAVATFQITTPATTTVISNYVPADAIVIPASATGSVQIILESSPDLVNWTAAEPRTYGASAGTNRFFRVRAVAN